MQAKQSQFGGRDFVIHFILGACSGGALALAAYLLIAPQVGPPPVLPFQDKLVHAVCLAGLTAPAVLVLPARYLAFWLAHMVMLGAGTRSSSPWARLAAKDLSGISLADVVRIALAVVIGRRIRRQIQLPKPR
jgi:hypothetical protein